MALLYAFKVLNSLRLIFGSEPYRICSTTIRCAAAVSGFTCSGPVYSLRNIYSLGSSAEHILSEYFRGGKG